MVLSIDKYKIKQPSSTPFLNSLVYSPLIKLKHSYNSMKLCNSLEQCSMVIPALASPLRATILCVPKSNEWNFLNDFFNFPHVCNLSSSFSLPI